jgi:hypothetical protein
MDCRRGSGVGTEIREGSGVAIHHDLASAESRRLGAGLVAGNHCSGLGMLVDVSSVAMDSLGGNAGCGG